MIEKIDSILKWWFVNHNTLYKIFIYLTFIITVILIIPLSIIYIIGSTIHKSFYTGTIYRKVGDRPEKVWL